MISPGGVGYDINCGVRLLRVRPGLGATSSRGSAQLVDQLFRDIPTGVGQSGRYMFDKPKLRAADGGGLGYVVEQGWRHASATSSSPRPAAGSTAPTPTGSATGPYTRGYDQCGTLGSGNHFLEVQVVDRIFDEEAAARDGPARGAGHVLIHSGSRGLGYQVCDDYLRRLQERAEEVRLRPARPAARLRAGREPRRAGATWARCGAAANYAWCNRQLLTHQAREVFARVFGMPLGAARHGPGLRRGAQHRQVRGPRRRRRRASRSASTARGRRAPSRPATPKSRRDYRAIGQPVHHPRRHGTASWVLAGQPGSMHDTFGTTCHGAGRMMSRVKARQAAAGRNIIREMEERGIIVRGQSRRTVDEEISEAYKDVSNVVDACALAGISRKVAQLRPIGCIKG